MTNLHVSIIDAHLGIDPDRQADAQVEALLVAANTLARAMKAKNGSDAQQLRGLRESIRRQLDRVKARAA